MSEQLEPQPVFVRHYIKLEVKPHNRTNVVITMTNEAKTGGYGIELDAHDAARFGLAVMRVAYQQAFKQVDSVLKLAFSLGWIKEGTNE